MQKLDDDDVANDTCEVMRMNEQEVAECKTDLDDARDVASMNEQEVAKRNTDLSEEYDMTSKIEEQKVAECKPDLSNDDDMTSKKQEKEVEECRKDADLCNYARLEQMESAWNEMKRIGQGQSLMEWICALKRKEGICKLRWAVTKTHDSVAR